MGSRARLGVLGLRRRRVGICVRSGSRGLSVLQIALSTRCDAPALLPFCGAVPLPCSFAPSERTRGLVGGGLRLLFRGLRLCDMWIFSKAHRRSIADRGARVTRSRPLPARLRTVRRRAAARGA